MFGLPHPRSCLWNGAPLLSAGAGDLVVLGRRRRMQRLRLPLPPLMFLKNWPRTLGRHLPFSVRIQVVPIPLPQIPNAEAATRTLSKRVSIPHVLFVIGA